MTEELRQSLLQAALGHVPFDGWSKTVIDAAADDLGVDRATAQALFPGGVADLIDAFYRWGDEQMLDAFYASEEVKGLGPRVERLVRLRIETCVAHKEAWRAAIGHLTLPMNLPQAAKIKMRTVDLIWRTAGDRSSDFSYYTKRATLAAVLSATTLFWLADDSEGYVETWGFLSRRIVDTASMAKFRKKVEEGMKKGCLSPGGFKPRFNR